MKNCLFLFTLGVFSLSSCTNENTPKAQDGTTDTTSVVKQTDTLNPLLTTKPILEIKKHFKCTGNEPFWSLRINDTLISFYEDGLEKTWKFPFQTLNVSQEKYTYRSSLGKKSILVKIAKDGCSDDMSGEPFEYSVTISKDGNNFSGCCKCLNDTLK